MSRVLEWFGNSGNAAFAASVVALTSLCVSAIAFWRTIAMQRRVVAIEEARERDRIIEQRKARLVARIVREARPGSTSLTNQSLEVTNRGKEAAKGIEVWLDGKRWSEHPAMLSRQKEVSLLGPESSFRYRLNIHLQQGPPNQVRITWRDESDEQGNYETTLT